MGNVLEYVSLYFTKWSATTAQYDSTNHIQICTSTSGVTIQHMASYNGHRGGTGNFGKNKTAKHCATISKACFGQEARTAQRQVGGAAHIFQSTNMKSYLINRLLSMILGGHVLSFLTVN